MFLNIFICVLCNIYMQHLRIIVAISSNTCKNLMTDKLLNLYFSTYIYIDKNTFCHERKFWNQVFLNQVHVLQIMNIIIRSLFKGKLRISNRNTNDNVNIIYYDVFLLIAATFLLPFFLCNSLFVRPLYHASHRCRFWCRSNIARRISTALTAC